MKASTRPRKKAPPAAPRSLVAVRPSGGKVPIWKVLSDGSAAVLGGAAHEYLYLLEPGTYTVEETPAGVAGSG